MRLLLSLITLSLCCGTVRAQSPSVRILPNLPSPQRVGTSIGLAVQLQNSKPGNYEYRYSVSIAGGPFHVISDFSPQQSFVWTPALYEHEARVSVTVRNAGSQESFVGELPYTIVPRVAGMSAVTGTANPLVALFSSPPCPDGSQFRVAFHRMLATGMNFTPKQNCHSSVSNNVYVAGMQADTDYQMQAEISKGSDVIMGTQLLFHTGLLDGSAPRISVPLPRTAGTVSEPLTLFSLLAMAGPAHATATDQSGNIIWYMRGTEWLVRMLPGGRFLTLADGPNSESHITRVQYVKDIDLAGNVLRETNIRAVAEQLASRGIASSCKKGSDQCVPGFHHEAIRLPNGHTLAIAGLERMFPAGTQGAKDRVDILGDLILDLDEDYQLTWIWNSFDHMDLKRKSISDEKCKEGEGTDGCTPVFLAAEANGWLHSNSLNYDRSSGDILVSIPEQDWVVKIDYKDGKGTGNVVWRLGADGDFTVKSSDPSPWFSYQHDVGFEPIGSNHLTLIDDGHARRDKDPKANNRGQVWQLDEKSKTATLLYNADLGVYSIAVGSAQALSNGGYSFEAGFINPMAPYARSVETNADGKVTYSQQVDRLISYRSFRVSDLYSPPAK